MTDFLEFDAYIRQGEPNQQERAAIWRTAIGLQAVDGLQTSDYLKETAKKHIEGEIDIDEARQLIKTYYQSKATREVINDDQCEADKVSANITKILSSISLDFSAKGFVALHRRIFDGVLKHAGEIRRYDITKKEWVLDADKSVTLATRTYRWSNKWCTLHNSYRACGKYILSEKATLALRRYLPSYTCVT